MKSLNITLILALNLAIFLVFCSEVSAKTYYIAPPDHPETPGNDLTGNGSHSSPWATWQKAFDTAEPGDTVYFRGGIYYSSGIATYPRIEPYGYVQHGHSGTAENPICFFNYPGEIPILDCSGQYSNGSIVNGISLTAVQYLHFKGLTIRNVFQRVSNKLGQGISMSYCANITFENMTVHDISGRGVFGAAITGYYNSTYTPEVIYCDTTRFINCDFYNLCDSVSSNPGNAADGIKVTLNGRTSTDFPQIYWYLYGCRFWNYSDDGTDIGGPGIVVHDHCWVSSTNKYSEFDIEGNGFKSGGVFLPLVPSDTALGINWRIFTNCIASNCNSAGFYDLDYIPYFRTNGLYFNNTSYNNSIGYYGLQSYSYRPRTTTYKNNIAYKNTGYEVALYRPSIYPESHNTWDATMQPLDWPGWVYTDSVTVTDDDFISLDYTELFGPRQADGSLPNIAFLKLDPVSDLVNSGTFVGLPYYDSAPEIGAFECDYQPGTFNKYPSVMITSPSDGYTFTVPDDITISVEATDADGLISKVEFFAGAIKLGEKTSAPWTCIWNNVPFGTHSLTAVATDNQGAKATSTPILVRARSNKILLYPNPNNGIFSLALTDPLRVNSKVTILSSEGNVIYNGTILYEELTKQFDLSYIKPGAYIFMLSSFEIIFTKVFIKR